MSSSVTKKKKAIWPSSLHKTFLDLCLEEIEKGNKPTTHFTKPGWRNIVEAFHQQTGANYDRRQIRNRWDMTKEQWRTWNKLIQDPSMKWDPETKSFGASEEDWACYLEENREAAPFRFKEIEYIDILNVLFDDDVPVVDGVGPRSGRKRPSESPVDSISPRKVQSWKKLENDGSCRTVTRRSPGTSSYRKVKACWTPAFHDIFLDLCLEQKLNGNKPGTHFTRDGWKNIMEVFNEKAGVKYTRIQIKNHWDSTKEQWRLWCKLIGNKSLGWDPHTSEFSATNQQWLDYLRENPEAAHYRYKTIQHAEKLEMLFDGKLGTVESLSDSPNFHGRLTGGSPASLCLADEQGTHQQPPERMGRNYDTTPESRSAILVEMSRPERQPVNSKPNDGRQPVNSKPTYSIGECIQCLDGMTEVQEGSDLYLFALDIFLKKEYREIFLQLKNSSVRISWLQRLQSFAPPLHI